MTGRRGHYRPTKPPLFAIGSKYGPLQTDGTDYLCPDCGGYGVVSGKRGDDKRYPCGFCKGQETIPLEDPRVTDQRPT